MSPNPACREYIPQLSPFVDGELAPGQRVHVERHLAACRDCAARVADLRAEAGLVRVGLEMLTDDVDFTGFSQGVLARLTPHKPPLWERLKAYVSETWTYQRAPLAGGLVAAAVLLAVVPLGWRLQENTYGMPAQLAIRSVRVDSAAHVDPVVLPADEHGDVIVWLVDHQDQLGVDASSHDEESSRTDPDKSTAPRLPREEPSGGEL